MNCSLRGSSPWLSPGQEYWSELPFFSPGRLPNRGIEPRSPTLAANSLPSELPEKSWLVVLQEGGPLPGPETGFLSNTQK